MPRERGLDFVADGLPMDEGNGPDMTLEWLNSSDTAPESSTAKGSSPGWGSHPLLMPPPGTSIAAGAGVGEGGSSLGGGSTGKTARVVSANGWLFAVWCTLLALL